MQGSGVLWLVLASLLAACGGYAVTYTFLNAPPHHITPREALQVPAFTPTSLPQRPYVEIGIVEAHASDEYSNDDRSQILLALRREAGRRGCEAIIVDASNEDQLTAAGAMLGTGSSTLHGFRGTCVVFR